MWFKKRVSLKIRIVNSKQINYTGEREMGKRKSGTHATRRETPGKSLLFVLPKL